jgi:hypothetical protein
MIRLPHNKGYIYVLAGSVLFIILLVFGINQISSARKDLKLLRDQQKEMVLLKAEYVSLKQNIDAVQGRTNLSNIQGIAQAVDEVFSSIGLRDRVKTVKTAGRRESTDGIEEEADIAIEKVTMNEMINIFYKIEHAPMVLTVKKATIKKSFENPELLNISLLISFLRTK